MTDLLPDWVVSPLMTLLGWLPESQKYAWLDVALQVLLILLIVLAGDRFGMPVLQRLARHLPFSRRLLVQCRRALRVAAFFLLLQIVFRDTDPRLHLSPLLLHLTALLTIASLTWLSSRAVQSIADTIVERNPINLTDNLAARRVHTQTRVLARSVNVLIILVGTGMALMTLPLLRQIGTSLLASAGVAGLIVGFAAKPVLGNLLAGLQLAISQPIRLDDVVIVENEWGQIEEITGTYVVVRIWDQRRLIVPLQWFIEHPFQNWTRNSAELLGVVMLWVDYRLPLEPLRAEAQRLCRTFQEWDGRVCVVQVTETNERAMQVRILVSAPDSPRTFDLRCKMREGLLDFIQRQYPDCLPRVRGETVGAVMNPEIQR
ncbi:mechanosensitive ion channel family protein [Noviherbaspirillum suwonense]|jgi:small-conductance mechanosensitive channel|nr:mechanosensitive ion channel domain-containing protein [Noviherbaspirillum suwonense]